MKPRYNKWTQHDFMNTKWGRNQLDFLYNVFTDISLAILNYFKLYFCRKIQKIIDRPFINLLKLFLKYLNGMISRKLTLLHFVWNLKTKQENQTTKRFLDESIKVKTLAVHELLFGLSENNKLSCYNGSYKIEVFFLKLIYYKAKE